MIFIYNCYGGTHSSSLAAAIHLGKLPADRIPERDEILGVAYFNKLDSKDMGELVYRGTDEAGHKVFTLGRGSSKVLLPCLKNLVQLISAEYGLKDKIILCNMSPCVPMSMTFGGLFSRRLGLHFIGVPLLVKGARKVHTTIAEVVRRARETAANTGDTVVLLMNIDKKRRVGFIPGG